MNDDKYKVAARMLLGFLKQTAKENGITENIISIKSGFIQPNVNRMFSGKYMPTLDNFIRLGEAVGVRVELHGPEVQTTAKIRNLEVPKFLFSPDFKSKQLYIIHTHFPACLIKVVQTMPASFEILENFDNSDDFAEVLIEARDFFRDQSIHNDEMMN